jgi:hypothetical protein
MGDCHVGLLEAGPVVVVRMARVSRRARLDDLRDPVDGSDSAIARPLDGRRPPRSPTPPGRGAAA